MGFSETRRFKIDDKIVIFQFLMGFSSEPDFEGGSRDVPLFQFLMGFSTPPPRSIHNTRKTLSIPYGILLLLLKISKKRAGRNFQFLMGFS